MAVVHALAHRQRNIGYRRHVSTCAGKKEAVHIGSCLYEGGYINSLSMCLKYPGFIFLCPQKLSKKNPRKKTKSLNYPNTIPEFFSEFGYVQDFFYVPRTIRGKKTNTLNYPNSIRYFGDLAKFSRILHENKIFYNLWFFCKNLAMFNSVL